MYPGPRGFLLFFIGKFCDPNRFLNFLYWHEALRAEKRKPLVATVGNLTFMPSAFDCRFWLEDIFNGFMSHIIGWIKYLWGWEWSVYVHLYGYGWRTFALSTDSLVDLAYSPLVIVDGFYLQEYFRRYFVISSSKPFRWRRANVWSTKWSFVWNSESRGRLRYHTDVDLPW